MPDLHGLAVDVDEPGESRIKVYTVSEAAKLPVATGNYGSRRDEWRRRFVDSKKATYL